MKILIVSYWTPPLIRPRAIMLGKLLQALKNKEIETYVLAYQIPGQCKAENQEIFYRFEPINEKRYWVRLIEHINIIPEWPRILNHFRAYNLAKKIVKQHKIDCVYTYAKPHAMSLVGLHLKKSIDCKWVAFFSDPWTDNPYSPMNWLRKLFTKFFEKLIIKNADALIYPVEEAAQLSLKNSPQYVHKKFIIPPGYDKPPRHSNSCINYCINSKKINICHAGAFYGKRTPCSIIHAAANLKRKVSNLDQLLEIHLIGVGLEYSNFYTKIASMLKDYQVENIFKLTKQIPYETSLGIMDKMDVLLVIDADISPNYFLPSKIADYIGLKKPIFAITPKNGGTSRITNEMGGITAENQDIAGIEKILHDILKKKDIFKLNRHKIDTKKAQKYSIDSTTDQLISVFRSVIAHH